MQFCNIVIVLLFLNCFLETDAWRRRRRRRRRRSCSPRNCEVSSWSSWSSCSAEQCGQQGSQRRTRWRVSEPSCGGSECPTLEETRLCYGTRSVNCQLSSWSAWSACSTVCGVSGIQTSTRHRVITERCGGTCSSTLRKTRACPEVSSVNCQLSSWSVWSACSTVCGVSGIQTSTRHRVITEQCGGTCSSTLRKTRACPELSCLNGGNLQQGTCFCHKDYSGVCCQKKRKKGKE